MTNVAIRKATDALKRMSNSQSKFRVCGFWERKSYRNAIRVAVTATRETSPMNRSKTTASGAPVWVVINPIQHPDGDGNLENCNQNLLHSSKRSFQIRTDWRIASAVVFGLISQTNKQFVGRSGTSLSKSIVPVKGASWSLAGHTQSCTWQTTTL